MNRIALKERIAVSDAFTMEERDFLLNAINAMPEIIPGRNGGRGQLNRIEAIWAYLSSDSEGEGVCAAPLQDGALSVPLIAADYTRLTLLRPVAVVVARVFNKPVRLVRFSKRDDMEVITP